MALSISPNTGSFQDCDTNENKRSARRLLARMERLEDHAQKAQGELPLPDAGLAEQDIAIFQDMFRNTYRRLVGVLPAERTVFRQELEAIQEFGHQSVEAVIESVRTSIDTQRILESHMDE